MPSEKTLAAKQAQLDELVAKIQNATSGVLVKYEGITVEQDTALRKTLREAGVDYKVYKNTMTRRACDIVGYKDMDPLLKGMTAIAVSSDPVAPAKILKEYADKIESFEIKAGFIDGEFLDQKGVMALAEIPSKEGLIVKMLGSLMSPLYGLAYALQAKIDKENAGSEAGSEAAAE